MQISDSCCSHLFIHWFNKYLLSTYFWRWKAIKWKQLHFPPPTCTRASLSLSSPVVGPERQGLPSPPLEAGPSSPVLWSPDPLRGPLHWMSLSCFQSSSSIVLFYSVFKRSQVALMGKERRHSGLRTQHCYCWGAGSIPGPGTSHGASAGCKEKRRGKEGRGEKRTEQTLLSPSSTFLALTCSLLSPSQTYGRCYLQTLPPFSHFPLTRKPIDLDFVAAIPQKLFSVRSSIFISHFTWSFPLRNTFFLWLLRHHVLLIFLFSFWP